MLAASLTYNSSGLAHPATLYGVSAGRAVPIRQIDAATFDVRSDLAGHIYVLDMHFTELSVVHTDDPQTVDVVPLNPSGRSKTLPFFWSAWGASAGPMGAFALFPDRNGGPWWITVVKGDRPERGVRVTKASDWGIYGQFRYSGAVSGPFAPTVPSGRVVSGAVVLPNAGGPPQFRLAQLPEELSRRVGDSRVLLLADTSGYLAITPVFGAGADTTTVYLLNRASGRWSVVDAPTASLSGSFVPTIRFWGNWMASTVRRKVAGNVVDPGERNERGYGQRYWFPGPLPNVRGGYAMQSNFYMPGLLVLKNLVDGREIEIHTGQQDSEVLEVPSSGQVLYRVNDEIFSTQIEGAKLGPAKLVVKGDDVPEVHWVFWSAAPPPKPPAAPAPPAGVMVQ